MLRGLCKMTSKKEELNVKLGTREEAHLTKIKEGLEQEKLQLKINQKINEYLLPFVEKLIEEEKNKKV